MSKRIYIIGMLVASLFLGGCSVGSRDIVITSGVSGRDVFKIGSISCSKKEARVYLTNYQNIYGNAYGINLWEQEFQTEELEKYVKDVTLQELTQIVCLNLLAREQGITLTQEESNLASEAATKYYNSLNEQELSYMDVSRDNLSTMYEQYALARKVYQSLIDSVDSEVSDDEARIMEMMQIYVSDKNVAVEVEEKLENGEDFATLASSYNEAAEIDIEFGRGDMPQEVEDIALELDNDENSGCIETEKGFYFLKCVNKFNEELTDANKEAIVEKRKKEAFDSVYTEFSQAQTSSIRQEAWDELELDTTSEITTNSFFTIYEEVFAEV